MAITGSGFLSANFMDILDTTALDIDFDLETHKGAIFDNNIVTDHNADTKYGVAPYNANEAANSTGWPTGGVALAGTALTTTAGTLKYDGTDYSQADTTFTAGEGYLLYETVIASWGILFVDFTAPVSPSAGTFTITWNAAGIATLDLVP